jgi:hypothetical protein
LVLVCQRRGGVLLRPVDAIARRIAGAVAGNRLDNNRFGSGNTCNEALLILDAAILIAVINLHRTVPPPTPAANDRHVIAPARSGRGPGMPRSPTGMAARGYFWRCILGPA